MVLFYGFYFLFGFHGSHPDGYIDVSGVSDRDYDGRPYIFKAQGGLGQLLENLMNNPALPGHLLKYHGNIPGAGATDAFGAVMYAVTMGIIWFITVSVSPWQAGRNMMAKSEHVTFRAGAIAAVCTVVFLMYMNLQSVAVINIHPKMEDPQRVLIWAAFHVMPKIVGTLMLAGIMAAGLSATGARWSMIAGFAGYMVTKCLVGFQVGSSALIFKNFLDSFFIGLYFSLLLAVIGSHLHPVTEAEKEYRSQLMILSEKEKTVKEYRIDKVYGYLLIAAGVAVTLFLLFGWALPYNGMI